MTGVFFIGCAAALPFIAVFIAAAFPPVPAVLLFPPFAPAFAFAAATFALGLAFATFGVAAVVVLFADFIAGFAGAGAAFIADFFAEGCVPVFFADGFFESDGFEPATALVFIFAAAEEEDDAAAVVVVFFIAAALDDEDIKCKYIWVWEIARFVMLAWHGSQVCHARHPKPTLLCHAETQFVMQIDKTIATPKLLMLGCQ